MLLEDLLELEPAAARVRRMSQRLIPLLQPGREPQPHAVRAFFAVYMLVGEAHNGSLHQYFSNSSGDDSALALKALNDMGLDAPARLFKKALALFKDGPSKDRLERNAQLEALSKKSLKSLEDFSSKLCDLSDEIFKAMSDFLAKNAAEFGFVDRYPNGFKAMVIPPEIDLDEVVAGTPEDRVRGVFVAINARVGAGEEVSREANAFRLAYMSLASLLPGDLYSFVEAVQSKPDEVIAAVRKIGLDVAALQALFDLFAPRIPRNADALEAVLKSWTPEQMRSLGTALQKVATADKDAIDALDRFVHEHPRDCPIPPPDPFHVVTFAFAAIRDKKTPSDAEIAFLDVFHLADEVSVAGFESYFFIRAADRHAETLKALGKLGLAKTEALLRRAIEILPAPFSRDYLKRREQLRGINDEKFAALNAEFQGQRREVAEALAKFVNRR